MLDSVECSFWDYVMRTASNRPLIQGHQNLPRAESAKSLIRIIGLPRDPHP